MAVKWIVLEEHSDRARALFRAARQANETLVAPPLLPIEITNVLYQRVRSSGRMSRDEASTLLADFLAFPIVLHNLAGLHQRALALADAYSLPPPTTPTTSPSPSLSIVSFGRTTSGCSVPWRAGSPSSGRSRSSCRSG